MRNDDLAEIMQSSHFPLQGVIVADKISSDMSRTEVTLYQIQNFGSIMVLANRE